MKVASITISLFILNMKQSPKPCSTYFLSRKSATASRTTSPMYSITNSSLWKFFPANKPDYCNLPYLWILDGATKVFWVLYTPNPRRRSVLAFSPDFNDVFAFRFTCLTCRGGVSD